VMPPHFTSSRFRHRRAIPIRSWHFKPIGAPPTTTRVAADHQQSEIGELMAAKELRPVR